MKNKRKKIITLIILFFFTLLLTWGSLAFNIPYQANICAIKEVSTTLSLIPKRDLKSLYYFFRELILWDQFGYVLVGEKPIAFGIIKTNVRPFKNLDNFLLYINPNRVKMVKGLKSWRKHAKKFPHYRYLILCEEDQQGNVMAIIVNKESFIKKVKEHEKAFEKVLGYRVNAEELFKKAKEYPLISEVLQGNDLLIGILLGYGEENSRLFFQRSKLSSLKEKIEFDRKLKLRSPWSSKECEDFKKEWADHKALGSCIEDLHLIAPPSFLCKPTSLETQYLKKQFIRAKQSIICLYEGKDFLATTLQLLYTDHDSKIYLTKGNTRNLCSSKQPLFEDRGCFEEHKVRDVCACQMHF